MLRSLVAGMLLCLSSLGFTQLHAAEPVEPDRFLQRALKNASDSYERYRWALETDRLVDFQALCDKGLGPNLVMPDGNPALVFAMVNESVSIVKWLLQHPQLDVDQKNARGDTALMLAAGLGQQEWVSSLIGRGGDYDPAAGWTPLHYAASAQRLSVVQYLVRKGARLDSLSPNGTTPLMMAARAGAIEVVRYLLAAGARADLENQTGFTALRYAQRQEFPEMEALLQRALKSQGTAARAILP